jgi:hypothetical protein
MLVFTAGFGYSQEKKNGPELTFDESLINENNIIAYDYGTIIQYSEGKCEIKFYNTGNQPLVLSRVRSSCGCTVPNWPRQPILPGKSAVIKVKYDTKKTGPFNKSITVESNASKPVSCRIKGKVITEAEASMPILHNTEGATPSSSNK